MKTHLFIGGGETPSERTKKIMNMMQEAGYEVEYRQLATSTAESNDPPTIIIWDEMLDMDFSDIENRYEHALIFGHPSQLPPIRESLGPHPIGFERVKVQKTHGKGPRNKWGKIR